MKIHEIVNLPSQEGVDVGIEIEVEGEQLPTEVSKYWSVIPDGSLRGGLEYVYKQPKNVGMVEETLIELQNTFIKNKSKPKFSFRTSVHVHVNCLPLTYQQVLNYIYTYYLLEDILVDFCGESRKGNRFCLRLQDADGSLEYIEKLFSSTGGQRVFRRIPRDMIRYAALNIEALPKFGTLEFRSMRGTLDGNVIIPWVETLVNIREYAKGFENSRAIFDRLEEIGERQFFQEAIGKHYPLLDNGKVERSINLGRSLSVNLPFIDPEERLLDGKHPEKMYRINGHLVSVRRLEEYFGDLLPPDIERQIREQDEAPPQPEAVHFRARRAEPFPYEEIYGELEEEEEDEEEDDEW